VSFILDALKKSESERQRQSGPALYEVKVAPPRTRLPPWAIAIAALLVVNLGIVMWMLLRHSAHGSEPAAASAASVVAPPAAALPAPVAAAPPPATVVAPPPATATTQVTPPPLSADAPATASAAAPGSARAPANEPNPSDYAPAEEPAPAGTLSTHVRRGTVEGVPLYQDAAATPGTQIPQLRLDLHVFAQRPQDRFVMINMHKLREGDSTAEGVHVDSITPEGALLSYNGQRFLLPRD
jgi:general secretion pathway protein B